MNESQKRFGEALFDLLRDEDAYLTSGGRVNLRAFAAEVEMFPYQTLRRATVGARPASVELMQECARVLRVRPEYFAEYRAEQARRPRGSESRPAAA